MKQLPQDELTVVHHPLDQPLNLAIIDQLNLLPQQFDQVYIPLAMVE